jgi:hypothetical protein
MRSALFSAENLEKESAQPGMRLQNSKMLKIELIGEAMARVGSMVAYQGQVQFQQALGSGGLGKFLKQKLTGEGVPLMKVTGRGDVFLAELAKDVHIIDLEPGDALSINGSSVLAFDSTLQYDIKMVGGAGGLLVGPVQPRLQRSRPDRDHHQGHPGGAQRGRSDVRRPAGRRLLVGEPPDRLPPGRAARPGHAARSAYR